MLLQRGRRNHSSPGSCWARKVAAQQVRRQQEREGSEDNPERAGKGRHIPVHPGSQWQCPGSGEQGHREKEEQQLLLGQTHRDVPDLKQA